jgi:ankyrin repeat protein
MISSNRNTRYLRSALSLRFCLSHIVFPPVPTLAWASGKGHIRVVRQLLNIDQFKLESRDLEDWTPLAHAARYRHSAVVSLLADLEGVDINS